jgi:hypothetical protein
MVWIESRNEWEYFGGKRTAGSTILGSGAKAASSSNRFRMAPSAPFGSAANTRLTSANRVVQPRRARLFAVHFFRFSLTLGIGQDSLLEKYCGRK